jgi:4-hydroxybenzoate polyprenyltransferase
MPSLRTLLVLGRTSNLPTVWSNCLAGWWLGGGGSENLRKLPALLLGTSLLYLGGMFLNDAFDADFDAQYRRERPIPSGSIPAQSVWRIGFGLLVAGLVLLFTIGLITGLLGIVLALCILIYDAIHKIFLLSPLFMAACRFFLYVIAASAAYGVSGWPVWCGLALACYIVGLSFLAGKETTRNAPPIWPCLLLAVPILLAFIMNVDGYRQNALLLSAVLALWVARSLRFAYRAAERNIGRSVSGLLAGIVLVDLLAVADVPHAIAGVFIGLFVLALLFQRYVPAT